jgi:hypothetical protein
MEELGRITWHEVNTHLQADSCQCPKLASYWTFHGCRYRKGAGTCANPAKLSTCLIPALPARNGRLAQSAIALFLFIRDICQDDLIHWIQTRLDLQTRLDPQAEPCIRNRLLEWQMRVMKNSNI